MKMSWNVRTRKKHNPTNHESFNKWSVKWFAHWNSTTRSMHFNLLLLLKWVYIFYKAFIKRITESQPATKNSTKRDRADKNMAQFTAEKSGSCHFYGIDCVVFRALVCFLCAGLLLFIDWKGVTLTTNGKREKFRMSHQQISARSKNSIPNRISSAINTRYETTLAWHGK